MNGQLFSTGGRDWVGCLLVVLPVLGVLLFSGLLEPLGLPRRDPRPGTRRGPTPDPQNGTKMGNNTIIAHIFLGVFLTGPYNASEKRNVFVTNLRRKVVMTAS